MLRNTEQSIYQVGQIWNYQTRAGEEDSLLTVVKVEVHPLIGNIIHVSLQGLRMKSPYAANGLCDVISHLPLSEDSITKSVTNLIGTQENLPDYEDGYAEWRQAFDTGEAGVWSIAVAECVDALEQVINNSAPPESDIN